jgi:hypothetical protein
MPVVTAPAFSIPPKAFPGSAAVPSGIVGELLYSQVMLKYATLVKLGRVQTAYATLTAPVAFGTAAASGGPLIWNKPTSGVDAHILAVGVAGVVASAAAGSIGLAGSTGQAIAPSSTTAIDASGNAYVGGPASAMGGIYRLGTVANPSTMFAPIFNVGTTATSAMFGPSFIDLGGAMVVPPGNCGFLAGSVVLTTLQVSIALIWAELPT